MRKKEWTWEGIVMVFLGFCAGVALLAWSGFTVVLIIMAIRDLG